jgi:hypothetical protein
MALDSNTNRHWRGVCALVAGASLWCTEAKSDEAGPAKPLPEPQPWFTGPLLAPTPVVIPPGHVFAQPYLFISDQPGRFGSRWAYQSFADNYSVNSLIAIQTGVLPFMDVKLVPGWLINFNQGSTDLGFTDLPVTLGFRILEENRAGWEPQIKLAVSETFPTGRYDNLDPAKHGADVTGGGSYQTAIVLFTQKSFHLGGKVFLRPRLVFQADYRGAFHVHGLNVYGGSNGDGSPHSKTDGVVRPGTQYTLYVSWELSLTQNWALAWDTVYVDSGAIGFRGDPGNAPINADDNAQNLSIAPAVEYNFSSTLGIIGGVWLAVVGKNTANFVTGTVSLALYY